MAGWSDRVYLSADAVFGGDELLGSFVHSGALAARELGGALNVQSAGPGKGATFTLEIPLAVRQTGAGNPPP